MEKQGLKLVLFIFLAGLVIGGFVLYDRYRSSESPSADGQKDLYHCPMHPNFTSDKPGDCAICGMSLVKRQVTLSKKIVADKAGSEKRKILYYRNPMDLTVTSPVAMKDQMGMDYVPVYEEETQFAENVVYINPQKQQLIGVKKEKVGKHNLKGQIYTVGIVAYDPDLYVTQQEYLQSLKASRTIKEQYDPMTTTAKRKLLLLGMSEEEIAELEKAGQPQQFLFLPGGGKIWVYITVYEYQMQFVEKGQQVKVEPVAYPGQIFNGTVVTVSPILDKMTRTLKVRALIDDPNSKLKPEMYVNVKIDYELGEKLAVHEDAVMRAGTRNYVFVVDANDHFYSRKISLGNKADNYYEILSGLIEGETIVTSGNFLIDSESKLNAVLNEAAESDK